MNPFATRVPARLWLWSAAAAVAAALIWAQFRGLDLLDTPTIFLSYQYPQDNTDTHTRYELLARPLWLACGQDIVAFRLLCLALISGAVLVFWRGWRPVVAGPNNGGWAGLTLWMSAMAGLAWLPVVLGYNSLSTLFALLALAALAPALGLGRPAQVVTAVAGSALFLAAVAATALVKPPAAVALAVWSGFLAACRWSIPPRWRIAAVGVAATCAFAVLFVLRRRIFAPGFDPTDQYDLGGVLVSPAWVVDLVTRYTGELAPFLAAWGGDLPLVALPAVGLAVLTAAKAAGRPVQPWLARTMLGVLAASVFIVVVAHDLWDGSFARAVSGQMARLYLVLWVALLPAWLPCLFGRQGSTHRATAPVIIALLFLPLTCGFGSTNTIYFSALNWTVFWSAGLLVVGRALASTLEEPQLPSVLGGILALTAGAHLFSGHFLRPYMFQPPLWRQTAPAVVGHPATTLRLDPATAHFLSDVRAALDQHGYHPGDDVFGFFNLPGVIFAVGAREPGAPWYFGTWYHGDNTDGGKIRVLPLERRQHAWIITQADVTMFRRQFKAVGIDFPDGYEKIGQTLNPTTGLEIGIWRPKARH